MEAIIENTKQYKIDHKLLFPFVTLTYAQCIDGSIAMDNGTG